VPRSPLPRRAAVTHAATASAGTAAPSPRRHVGIDDEEMDTMIECLIRLINDDFVTGLWTSKPLDKQSIVASLERLVMIVLTSEFRIKLSGTHLHVFKDEHDLTIPAQPLLLTPQAFATMERIKRMSRVCFKSVRAEVAGFNQHHSDFIGDERMNREFPRHIFLLRLVARGLCASAARAELEHLVLALRCALRRAAVKIPVTSQHFVWKLYADLGDNDRVLSVAKARAQSRPLLTASSQGILHLPPSHTGTVVVRRHRPEEGGNSESYRRGSGGPFARASGGNAASSPATRNSGPRRGRQQQQRSGLFADRAASAGGLADCVPPTRPRTRGGGLF